MNDPRTDIYQETILDHNRRPRHFGKPEIFTHSCMGFNRLCGDKVELFLTVGNDQIERISFEGKGCALCMASSSILTELIAQKSSKNALELAAQTISFLKKQNDAIPDEQLKIFSEVWKYPMRVKCVTLSWHTLQGALAQKPNVESESWD